MLYEIEVYYKREEETDIRVYDLMVGQVESEQEAIDKAIAYVVWHKYIPKAGDQVGAVSCGRYDPPVLILSQNLTLLKGCVEDREMAWQNVEVRNPIE